MKSNLKEALIWILDILNEHNIPYAITGGLAAHIYGSKREINDIDIDIPEYRFEEIINEVREYIVEPLEDYKDKKWDLRVLTLNYKGQDIDIGGSNNTKIFNEQTNKWEAYPTNLNTVIDKEIFGIKVKVVNPIDLIVYKKALISKNYNSEHQVEDIRCIEKYLEEET